MFHQLDVIVRHVSAKNVHHAKNAEHVGTSCSFFIGALPQELVKPTTIPTLAVFRLLTEGHPQLALGSPFLSHLSIPVVVA